ncbi:MAG: T9SS type A sorting domain-containing protein [FCB group bacterium]|nr:T9SS type A sorting domain-containing protein [FCB group bacterium]
MKRFLFALMMLALVQGVSAQADIIIFSDSPNGNQLYDASWGYEVSPSYLELAGNNDKFPVDSQHPYQGAHSLRLHWISQAGGDWGIAVASTGWGQHDITQYDSIGYWINAPAEITQADLPDLAIEDIFNHKSTRVWLGDYLGGVDSDSATWQRVMVPIDAFEAGPDNCDFTQIKTIFHFQKNPDGGEHIAWLDEIRIIRAGGSGSTPPTAPDSLIATGFDRHINLKWGPNSESDLSGYYIYRASTKTGPFTKLNAMVYDHFIYNDFFGENDRTYYYYVTAVNLDYLESPPSDTVFATTHQLNDDELLDMVQKAAFEYFWYEADPVTGLVQDRMTNKGMASTSATGFGLTAICVAESRGWISRGEATGRVLSILRTYRDIVFNHNGVFPHYLNPETGAALPLDFETDLVETTFFIAGALTARKYFNQDTPEETDIRNIATQLYENVQWDAYLRDDQSLNWGWDSEGEISFGITGYNEAMLAYILAIGSPTYPIPPETYYEGWARTYVGPVTYYDITLDVLGWHNSMFIYQYSHCWIDYRGRRDDYTDYFQNAVNAARIQKLYAIENPLGNDFPDNGYNEYLWGLTACDGPGFPPYSGYYGRGAPNGFDDGTIAPTAAVSSVVFTPAASIATMRYMYDNYGWGLWGRYGFEDSFNLDADPDWFDNDYIGIDQGPIVIMIENYRSGLVWDYFMQNEEISNAMDSVNFVLTTVEDENPVIAGFSLGQNYPNPFNPVTTIQYNLPENSDVQLIVYDIRGREVIKLVDNNMNAGQYSVRWEQRPVRDRCFHGRLYLSPGNR